MFRRSQIESAIALSLCQVAGPDEEIVSSLRHDLKRLIDTDRTFPDPGADAAASERNSAFSEGERPGKGTEQEYSALDVLMVLIAYELARAGFTQRRAVRKARLLRPWLAREVKGRLSEAAGSVLTEQGERALETMMRDAEGVITDPNRRLHLALALDGRTDLVVEGREHLVNLFMGDKTMAEVLRSLGLGSSPVLVMDVGSAFVRLSYWLNRTSPVRRGRKA